jgi:hypothetical protein
MFVPGAGAETRQERQTRFAMAWQLGRTAEPSLWWRTGVVNLVNTLAVLACVPPQGKWVSGAIGADAWLPGGEDTWHRKTEEAPALNATRPHPCTAYNALDPGSRQSNFIAVRQIPKVLLHVW